MKSLEKKARAYALKNAISYGGKSQSGPVISALFNEGLDKRDVGKYAKKILEIIKEVNSLNLGEQKKEFEKFKLTQKCPKCNELSLKFIEGKIKCSNCSFEQNVANI